MKIREEYKVREMAGDTYNCTARGAKQFFTEKVYLFFQIIPLLGESLFPFIGSIDSCLKCFYHLFEIVYHVLQLMELDIFRTVCHCFFLLFLIFPLYQKTGTFPSKTADLPRLESAENTAKNASFMCIFFMLT